MPERRTITTPADVPKSLVGAAEDALAMAAITDPGIDLTPNEAIRIVLAAVLPAYELRLGAEIGQFTVPCRIHPAPAHKPDCWACQRYAALIGARNLVERRGGYAGIPRTALAEADDGHG